MKPETLSQGLLLLTAAYPGVSFTVEAFWPFFENADHLDFKAAVMRFVKTQKEIYPGTGPIAILIDITNQEKKRRLENPTKKAITDEVCDPPPPEFYEFLRKNKPQNRKDIDG